jgi:hypothetical protein
MDSLLGGVQRFTGLVTGDEYQRTFTRAENDPDTLTWSPWLVVSVGTAPFSSRYNGGAQALTTAVSATVTFTGSIETTGFASFSSGVWTIAKAGRYLIEGTIGFDGSTVGRRIMFLFRNGAEVYRVEVPVVTTQNITIPFSTTRRLAVGDTIEVKAYQNSGGNLDVLAGLASGTGCHTQCQVDYQGA